MFTAYTWQDWKNAGMDELESASKKKGEYIQQVIRAYKASADFKKGLEANEYFDSNNPRVMKKVILRASAAEIEVTLPNGQKGKTMTTRNRELVGNRIPSNFFFRFVTQQNQHLLGNGVTLANEADKEKLGLGFDSALQQIGESALVHGVAWGMWNYDHLEFINAVEDGLSGFVALVDEMTQEPMVGIQFWQINRKKPMCVRLFERDGITGYQQIDTGLNVTEEKRAYVQTSTYDGIGEVARTGRNYDRLPIVPLYANPKKQSELSAAIKSKIDLYDRIISDFGDNLDRTNDVYWVLNNYGGSSREIAGMLKMIDELRVVANYGSGGTASTAEPKTIEVPYNARQTALVLLERAMYKDYMATNMDEITGGSLTNVAIQTAFTAMNLKVDRYEWQVFNFVQNILNLIGIETERITFKRQEIVNRSEIVQDIYTAAQDLDRKTRLKLNPYIMQEDIDEIDAAVSAQELPSISSTADLMALVERTGSET